MSKSKKKVIVVIGVALITVFVVLLTLGLVFEKRSHPEYYTLEEHKQRIAQRVEERFMSTGEYTSYSISPIYDENDKLTHFVVDFEPTGYIYVMLKREDLFSGNSMYMINIPTGEKMTAWTRYKIAMTKPASVNGCSWSGGSYIEIDGIEYRYWWEINSEGEEIKHSDSYYNAANIDESEKRYLIKTADREYVPAVKVNGKFLNLISLEEYTLQELRYDKRVSSVNDIFFGVKPTFNL